MSHTVPGPSQWVDPPIFTVAHTGYLSGDVERLLDILEDAADRGQPLDPLIDARSLTRVSFGDDMGEVDAFLAALRSTIGPGPHAATATVTTPASVPSVPVEVPRSAASQQILAHVDAARFRMARRSVSGYEVGTVDDFLDDVVTQVQSGNSILPTIRNVRFPIAPRGSGGYEVGDVDVFLDKIQSLAGDDAPAAWGLTVQNPEGRSTGNGLIRPILWAVGIAILIYLALFIL